MVQNFKFPCVRVVDQDLQSVFVEASVEFVGDDIFSPLVVLIAGEELEEERRDAGQNSAMSMHFRATNLKPKYLYWKFVNRP